MRPHLDGQIHITIEVFCKEISKPVNELIFDSCCGSSIEMKEKKFGHGLVSNKIKNILNDKCMGCEALLIMKINKEMLKH
jgi:hypothetical protein